MNEKPHLQNVAHLSCFFVLLIALLLFYQSTFAQSPRVDSIEPSQGQIAGGTTVIIRGVNFTGATVYFDNLPIIPLAILDTEISLVTPPHDNGFALIKIRNETGSGVARFLYLPPTLDEIPPGYITTIAGVGNFSGDGGPASQATVEPGYTVIDSNGNLYISEGGQYRIRRVLTHGFIETYAGTGVLGLPENGRFANETQLGLPIGLAVDTFANLFIADQSGHQIYRVDAASQIITHIAGTPGDPGFSGDGGPALQAKLNSPAKIAVDKDGTIFVLDNGNYRIRIITPDGTIDHFAGTGTPGFSGDGGPAKEAQFDADFADAGGLAIDPEGNLYLADSKNSRIRKIDRHTGIINTIAQATEVRALKFDASGNLYFAINGSNFERIIKMSPSGATLAAYGRGHGFSEDGTPAQSASLGFIDAIELDLVGNIIFTEISTSRVRRIDVQTGLLETVAGIGPGIINETGPAVAAVLNNNEGDLLFLPSGDLLFSDGFHNRLRQIDTQGNIETVGGTFLDFGTEEGPAHEVNLSGVRSLELDLDGTPIFSSNINIRRLDNDGFIRCVACSDEHGFTGDGGPATEARFTEIHDLAIDKAGNIFIADAFNMRVRRIDRETGIINTVAGSGPTCMGACWGFGDFCGDGGPALSACLDTPLGVAVDSEGNLFITDGWNSRIRKVDTTGVINTFVVTNEITTKMVFDTAGNLYAILGSALWKFNPDGLGRKLAGANERRGFSGDGGPAIDAQFLCYQQASGIAIDKDGNLFFADGGNRRIRAIKYGTLVAPPNATIAATGGDEQSVTAGARLSVPMEVTVQDESGGPAFGVRVDFTAPNNGPSVVFSNGGNTISVTTNRFGKAQIVGVANCEAGTYAIDATPLGSTAVAHFSITNTANPGGNPIAGLNSLSPHTVASGAHAFSLRVYGSNFIPCATVRWNGSDRLTTFFSDTLLLASILANDIDSVGIAEISVFNPAPGGGVSLAVPFPILPAQPQLVSPQDSTMAISTTPTLIWNASPGATSYHLQVASIPDFSLMVINDSSLTTNSRQVGPLASNATYFWRVSAEAPSGRSTFSSVWRFTTGGATSVEQTGTAIPTVYNLSQNYPNPFNPFTTIEFALPERAEVRLILYNVLGGRAVELVDDDLKAGLYKVNFDATGLSSGIYFYRIQANDFFQTRKLTLVK